MDTVYAGTLSCTVRTSSCNGGEVEIFEMQNTSNSHAGLPAASYNNLVCCTGVTGLGNSCSGTYATALKLSGTSNAHARQGTLLDYPSATNACISVSSGDTVSVGYQATNCSGYDTTLGSMVGTTNSHIGDANWTAGTTKICATAATAGPSTAIEIVSKSADTAITTITFPEGAPSATISNPYNDVDTVSNSQVLSGTVSEPVVRLKNTSGGTLNVTLEITTWTNSIAASEDYELVATTDTTVASVASALSTDGNSASVATGVSMTTGTYKALYLELVLSAVAKKTGNSTLTILGETP